MLGAWQYAVSTIERGYTATFGLEDFRSGGGSIRTSDWYYLAGQARESQASGDLVQGLPFETPIPGHAYTTVEIDYGQKYVAVLDVKYIDNVTGQVGRRTITLEDDEIRTWNDIESEAKDVVQETSPPTGGSNMEVIRARFYSPRWIEW